MFNKKLEICRQVKNFNLVSLFCVLDFFSRLILEKTKNKKKVDGDFSLHGFCSGFENH